MDPGVNQPGRRAERRRDCGSASVVDVRVPGRVRPRERPPGLRRHQERHEPVSWIRLRRRARTRLELELVGEHAERQSEARARTNATRATQSAARSASPAARTSCSSFTRKFSPRTVRRRRHPLPGADAARAAGRLFADDRQHGSALQPDSRCGEQLPCTAADTRGCFQDGGVVGRIPQNRLYGLGVNILKTYPAPNVEALTYNLETVTPNVDSNTYQHVVRVDYQASSKLRLSAKYAGQNATVQPIYPTNPGRFPVSTIRSSSSPRFWCRPRT